MDWKVIKQYIDDNITLWAKADPATIELSFSMQDFPGMWVKLFALHVIDHFGVDTGNGDGNAVYEQVFATAVARELNLGDLE